MAGRVTHGCPGCMKTDLDMHAVSSMRHQATAPHLLPSSSVITNAPHRWPAAAQALRSLKQEHVASVRFEMQQRVMEMRAIDARLQQLQAGR